MAGADITWSAPDGSFNLRAAAIIVRAGKVLVCAVDGLGYWILPGGRVRLGEPAEAALARELTEELGHDLPAGRLALVVENIYVEGGLQHEIGFYYQLRWPDHLAEDDLDAGKESGHRFRWVPVRELGFVDFQPAELAPDLCALSGAPRHVLLDRRGA